jgi:hypothetical protein
MALIYDTSGVTELLIWIHIWCNASYSETWKLKKQIQEKLLIFERKIIRGNCGPTFDLNDLKRRRANEEISILSKQRNMVRYIKAQRLA